MAAETLVRETALVAGLPPEADPDDATWRGGGLFTEAGVPDRSACPEMARAPGLDPAAIAGAEALDEAIFCGRFRPHFGHFLAESLGRLWALDRLGPALPLLWFATPAEAASVGRIRSSMLDLLGVANPVRIAGPAIRVARLHVPECLNDPVHRIAADPVLQDWIVSRLPAPPATGPDLYISRSRLPEPSGRYLAETTLEAALAAEGFRVIHPQTMSLAAQVAAYRAARRIVLAEGSPMHLLALLDVPGQRIALIRRRRKEVKTIPPTMASFRRARASSIVHVGAMLSAHPTRLFRAAAEIDMAAVWADLAAAGFVAPGSRPPIPDPAALAAERAACAALRPHTVG